MAKIFGFELKRKKQQSPVGRPKKSKEEKDKDWARRRFLEKAKKDPELENQYISKLMNIEIKSPDTVKQRRRELESELIKRALDKIEQNPELAERFVQTQIDKFIGEAGTAEGEEGEGYESPLGQAIQQWREAREFEKEIGGGKGALGGIIDSDVVKSFIENVVGPMLINKGLAAPIQKVYVVETPQGTLEMSAQQYQQYLLEEKKRLSPPKAELPPEEKAEVLPKVSLNINSWLPYLEQEPETFVSALNDGLILDEQSTQFVINILSTKTADEILTSLQSFKSGEYKEAIEELEKHKDWLEKVIEQVKLMKESI